MPRAYTFAALLWVVASTVTAHAQESRPHFRPDGSYEYESSYATDTLIISDCESVTEGEVAGLPFHGRSLMTCRVRILSQAHGADGRVATALDVRTNFAWSGEHWWTETRHGLWVLHRIYVAAHRVLISRMTSHAEPAQNFEIRRP